MLLHLPVELLSYVIEGFELTSIVRCRQVSQALRTIIDSSLSIQYSIELFASGVLDNLPSPSDASITTPSKSESLAALRRINTAWKYLRHIKHSLVIPNENLTTMFGLSGGIFIQNVNKDFEGVEVERRSQCTLAWLQLPSSFRGLVGCDRHNERGEEPRWMTREIGFCVSDLCLDVDRDLIILVERKDRETILPVGIISYEITCILHLFSFSSFSHHPDASQPTISVSFISPNGDYMTTIRLGGDHLVLLLRTRDRELTEGLDRIFLYDWMSGVRKHADVVYKEAVIPQWDTVCFISHDAFLLPDSNRSALNLYSFTDEPMSLVRAASLYLPQTNEGAILESVTARSEPIPRNPHAHRLHGSRTTTARASQLRPFTTDPESAIVVLTLQYRTNALPHAYEEPELTLVVRRSALLDLARRSGIFTSSHLTHQPTCIPLEWEAWGPSCTRWGLGSPVTRWEYYTHGQRFVSVNPVSYRNRMDVLTRITVYDFNMMNAERDFPMGYPQVHVFPPNGPSPPQSATGSENQHIIHYITDTGGELLKGGSFIWRNLPFGDHEAGVLNVTTKSVTSCPRIFVNDIVSSLPYRAINPHEVFDWDSVMIDDERIIGLKEIPDAYPLEFLEVLVL